MFSSEYIKNEVLTIKYEHPSSEDHFERKSQVNISSSDKRFGNNKKNNQKSSREITTRKKTCSHQNTFKMKRLLSPLNIYLIKIS